MACLPKLNRLPTSFFQKAIFADAFSQDPVTWVLDSNNLSYQQIVVTSLAHSSQTKPQSGYC